MNERREELMSIICEGQNSIQREEVENYINNLQSKIGKAIEYIENHFIFDDENGEYYQTHTFDKDNAKELHDILKGG